MKEKKGLAWILAEAKKMREKKKYKNMAWKNIVEKATAKYHKKKSGNRKKSNE